MTLVIAGDRSGVGKTTITLALLATLRRRGATVQSFKVGPDYIDPMFHRRVTGRPCRNLDPVLTSETYVQQSLARHTQGTDYSLVEGVMGLFDGVGSWDWGSTAHVARLLNCPILLVIDCARLSGSIAALAQGFQQFDRRLQFAGVVLNRVGSDRHAEILTQALSPLGLPVLGLLRREEQIQIPDRHLGLIPTEELPHLEHLIERLAHLGETCFDWPRLLPLLQSTPLPSPPLPGFPTSPAKTRIAIAQDRAFNFYYPDNLELLEHLGAELVYWSPLQDSELPAGIQGLYLGGGFPEMFAPELSANKSVRNSVGAAIAAGIPTYAECGGLMYLCQQITTLEGQPWPMVGTLAATTVMDPRLTLGYRQGIALRDSPLISMGMTVTGHEFHRSRLMQPSPNPLFELGSFIPKKVSAASLPVNQSNHLIPEGWQHNQLHASYLHLHWGDRPHLPQRFIEYCRQWQPWQEGQFQQLR